METMFEHEEECSEGDVPEMPNLGYVPECPEADEGLLVCLLYDLYSLYPSPMPTSKRIKNLYG